MLTTGKHKIDRGYLFVSVEYRFYFTSETQLISHFSFYVLLTNLFDDFVRVVIAFLTEFIGRMIPDQLHIISKLHTAVLQEVLAPTVKREDSLGCASSAKHFIELKVYRIYFIGN